MSMIKFNDLNAQWKVIKDDAMPEIQELFETSQFILGPHVERFEKSFATFCSCQFGIGISNGTDAIKIAAKALDLGNSPTVFMPANTFVATWIGIKDAYPNSEIVLIDIDEHGQMDLNKLDWEISNNTNNSKLIVPVHMYGCCDTIDEIHKIRSKYNYRDRLGRCALLEDASQAHGAKSTKGTIAGSIGDISAFSLYPGKNLGAAGDAGIITTNNERLAKKCRMLRNYGSEEKYVHKEIGFNHRLDSLQAIILYWKLKHLERWNDNRSAIATKIKTGLKNKHVKWMLTYNTSQVYHILPVLLENEKKRNVFTKYLDDNNIQNGIHYPIPIHKMPFYEKLEKNLDRTEDYSKRMVSLPIHPFLTDNEIEYVLKIINQFKC